MNKLKRGISISITPEESELLETLRKHGITVVSIFRRGIREIEQDYVKELGQNNNA